MDKKKIQLQIVTPHEVKLNQQADMVIIRSLNGDMGFLPNHEDTSVVLDDGILRIIDGKTEQKMAVFGGIAQIKNNQINVLTNSAERPEDIDRARAEKNRKQLELLLQEKKDDLKIQSYQLLLRRALVQIEVSTHADVNEQDQEE